MLGRVHTVNDQRQKVVVRLWGTRPMNWRSIYLCFLQMNHLCNLWCNREICCVLLDWFSSKRSKFKMCPNFSYSFHAFATKLVSLRGFRNSPSFRREQTFNSFASFDRNWQPRTCAVCIAMKRETSSKRTNFVISFSFCPIQCYWCWKRLSIVVAT